MKRRLIRLSAPFSPIRQLRIFNFPLHFGSARRKLGTFVSTLFSPNPFSESPFLRGFYFTAVPVNRDRNAKTPTANHGKTVGKTYFSGYPLRDECFTPITSSFSVKGGEIKDIKRPILFITGGGNGSLLVNNLIRKNLPALSNEYFIVHQVGKNYIGEYAKLESENYHPIPFINNNMISYFKAASIVISRAGAGTVSELLALKKRSIFIPLKIAQKNEQYHNAQEAQNLLGSKILSEDMARKIDLKAFLKEFSSAVNKETKVSDKERAKDKILGEIDTFFKG